MRKISRRSLLVGVPLAAIIAAGCAAGDAELSELQVKPGNKVATFDVIDPM